MIDIRKPESGLRKSISDKQKQQKIADAAKRAFYERLYEEEKDPDVHPMADQFPMMNGKQWKDFKASVAVAGEIREPFVIDQDAKLIDGRNRYRAWKELKDEGHRIVIDLHRVVVLIGLDDQQLLDMVKDLNLHRRHLSLGERVKMKALEVGNSKDERSDEQKSQVKRDAKRNKSVETFQKQKVSTIPEEKVALNKLVQEALGVKSATAAKRIRAAAQALGIELRRGMRWVKSDAVQVLEWLAEHPDGKLPEPEPVIEPEPEPVEKTEPNPATHGTDFYEAVDAMHNLIDKMNAEMLKETAAYVLERLGKENPESLKTVIEEVQS